MAKRTPLYEEHIKHGGKMVEFAGYELPIQYPSGLMNEHHAVRQRAGIFDVSHMGELWISGEQAESALNQILTNSVSGMYDGQVRYSILPNHEGGAVDDILVYRINSQKYMLAVNACNVQKDYDWIAALLPHGVDMQNLSSSTAQIALQGKPSFEILRKLMDGSLIPKKYYSFVQGVSLCGHECLISRTGYTGEKGYEIYCQNHAASQIFDQLLQAGSEYGLIPCGLGARDTLRLEAAMPLYGHELGDEIPVNEVGLDFAIKYDKPDFVGKAALLAHSPKYERIGVRVADRGIAREGCPVLCNQKEVGIVTSGTHSPTLGYAVAMLRVQKEYVDSELYANVRGRLLRLERVSLPFYSQKK